MNYDYDPNVNRAYILINNSWFAYSKELDGIRFIDYAEDGTVIGIELPYVNGGADVSGLPYQSEITKLLEKRGIKVTGKILGAK